jgi:hypothetical protein
MKTGEALTFDVSKFECKECLEPPAPNEIHPEFHQLLAKEPTHRPWKPYDMAKEFGTDAFVEKRDHTFESQKLVEWEWDNNSIRKFTPNLEASQEPPEEFISTLVIESEARHPRTPILTVKMISDSVSLVSPEKKFYFGSAQHYEDLKTCKRISKFLLLQSTSCIIQYNDPKRPETQKRSIKKSMYVCTYVRTSFPP